MHKLPALSDNSIHIIRGCKLSLAAGSRDDLANDDHRPVQFCYPVQLSRFVTQRSATWPNNSISRSWLAPSRRATFCEAMFSRSIQSERSDRCRKSQKPSRSTPVLLQQRTPCREIPWRCPSRLRSRASPAASTARRGRRTCRMISPRPRTCRRHAVPSGRPSPTACRQPVISSIVACEVSVSQAVGSSLPTMMVRGQAARRVLPRDRAR